MHILQNIRFISYEYGKGKEQTKLRLSIRKGIIKMGLAINELENSSTLPKCIGTL